MPTLYYKHHRAEDLGPTVGYLGDIVIFQIPQHYQVDDHIYLCVVYEGKVYAGRKIFTNAIGHNALHCIDYSNNETGKQILLKHFIQGD